MPGLPAKGAKDQIHNEKGAHQNQRDKVQPRPVRTHTVVHLNEGNKNKTKK